MSRPQAILAHLDAQDVRAALIGGMALAVHGIARSTLDVDLFTDDTRVLDSAFWSDGPEIRRGDDSDPLGGLVRWGGGEPVDLIVGRGALASEIVARRRFVEVAGVRMPVVEAGDLILLKLIAGGPQDLLDVQLMLQADDGAWRTAVEDRISKAPRDAQDAWRRIGG